MHGAAAQTQRGPKRSTAPATQSQARCAWRKTLHLHRSRKDAAHGENTLLHPQRSRTHDLHWLCCGARVRRRRTPGNHARQRQPAGQSHPTSAGQRLATHHAGSPGASPNVGNTPSDQWYPTEERWGNGRRGRHEQASHCEEPSAGPTSAKHNWPRCRPPTQPTGRGRARTHGGGHRPLRPGSVHRS